MKRIFFAGIGIFLLFVLSACPQAAIDDADDRGDDFPDLGLEEFSLNAASMVLFIDGGEKRLTALIPSEIAGLVEIEWSMNETSVVEISVDDDSVVVVPKDVGNAEIKAVIKSKFNNLNISEVTCHVTVLEDFDLDAQRLLMFVDDSPKKVSARVPPAMLDVAEIEWSLDSARNDAFALQNEAANSVDIETLGVEAIGVVTATLKAKNAAAFNGEGRSAVCVVTTLSRPFIEFPQSAYSYMLRPNDTSRTSLLTALYGPSKIDAYNPQVSWVSDDTEIVAFNEAGSVSMGRATTMITAKSAGSTVISVTLSIPDVMETSISVPVSVVPYDVPENSVTSLTLDIKPASIVRTMYTELITANLTGAGGSPPSDPDVEWLVDELGVVELVDGGDAYNRSIYVLGIWDGLEPKTVTVTAMSVSNPDITDWFTITASHFNVTVTTEAPDASTVLSVDNPNPINLKAVINGISNTAVAWSSDMPQFVTLTTPQEESGDTVTVSLKDNVLINGTKTVRITAVSLADNVTSGYIDIQILPHTFMVRYHKNDGSSITQMGGPYSFGSNTQTLDAFAGFNWIWTGYRNRGWSISAVGPLVYRDEALISALNDNENAAHHGGTVDLYARWLDDMSFEDEEDFAVTDVIYRYTINDQHEWNNVVQAIKNSGQGNYVINIQTNFTFNASSLLNSFMFGEAASFDQKTISIRGTDRMEKRTVRLYQHDGQLSAPDAFFVLHQNQHIILRNIKFIGYAGNVSNSNAYPFLIAHTGSTFEMKSGAVLDTLNNNNYVNDQNGSAALINIMDGAHFIMRDDAEILNSNLKINAQNIVQSVVFVDSGAYVDMFGSSKIDGFSITQTRNDAYINVKGILVRVKGFFTMYDASALFVNQSSTSWQGGGYALYNHLGSGVYVENNGICIMNGTSKIQDRRDIVPSDGRDGLGGGVYINTGGSFTMNDNSSIDNCGANMGGNVFINGGTFTMNDSSSLHRGNAGQGNNLYINGGYFYMNDSATLTRRPGDFSSSGGIRSNIALPLSPTAGSIHIVKTGGIIYGSDEGPFSDSYGLHGWFSVLYTPRSSGYTATGFCTTITDQLDLRDGVWITPPQPNQYDNQ